MRSAASRPNAVRRRENTITASFFSRFRSSRYPPSSNALWFHHWARHWRATLVRRGLTIFDIAKWARRGHWLANQTTRTIYEALKQRHTEVSTTAGLRRRPTNKEQAARR